MYEPRSAFRNALRNALKFARRSPITPSDGAPCSHLRRMPPTDRPPVLAPALRRRHAALLTLAGSAALLVASPGTALAAAAAKPTGDDVPLDLGGDATGGEQVGTGSGSIARVLVGLLIVVAVIYGVTWLLKQLKGGGAQTPSADGLEQLTSLPLQGGGALSLVRVGDELLLVGSGANGASTLRRYTEEEARELGLWPDEDRDPGDPDGPAGGSGGGNVVVVLGRTLSALRARSVRPGPVVHRSTAAPRTFLAPGADPAASAGPRTLRTRAADLVDRVRAMTVRG